MDISDTLAPKSDQLDAVDLLGSPPRIFTVEKVSRGNAEQPVQVHLAEFPRVWRPGKSMRRVLAHLWGSDASKWPGRRVELFCDEGVMFGGEKVGGIRISRMSHIDGPKSVPIIITKGRSGGYKVTPLPDAPAQTPPTGQLDSRGPLARRMFAAMGDAGITERADRLKYVSDVVGREVASSTEMTEDDARAVIDALAADTAAGES